MAPSANGPAHRERDLAPLHRFRIGGGRWPPVTFLEPEGLPDPQRRLLAHATALTPRLRDFHQSPIDIVVHARETTGTELARAGVLQRRHDARPVAFGAIRVWLQALPEPLRADVQQGRVPFGGLLEAHGVPHCSQPRSYFSIVADATLAGLLGAAVGQTLYGRCNELRLPRGAVLAEMVEILPGERLD